MKKGMRDAWRADERYREQHPAPRLTLVTTLTKPATIRYLDRNGHYMVAPIIGHHLDGTPMASQIDAQHADNCWCVLRAA